MNFDGKKVTKVIFLDIDGVLFLNAGKTYEGFGFGHESIFDSDCCKRLKKAIDATGCKLVLTSSLRLHEEGRTEVFKSLAPFGITADDFVGITPDVCSADRSLEILTFLKGNSQIVNYIVIDDQEIGYKIPKSKIIKTNSDFGITEDIMKKAIMLLS